MLIQDLVYAWLWYVLQNILCLISSSLNLADGTGASLLLLFLVESLGEKLGAVLRPGWNITHGSAGAMLPCYS